MTKTPKRLLDIKPPQFYYDMAQRNNINLDRILTPINEVALITATNTARNVDENSSLLIELEEELGREVDSSEFEKYVFLKIQREFINMALLEIEQPMVEFDIEYYDESQRSEFPMSEAKDV